MSSVEKQVADLANLSSQRFKKLEEQVEQLNKSISQTGAKSGEDDMPKYRCRGKGCNFETEDIGDFVEHSVGEQLQPIREQLTTLSKAPQPQSEQQTPKRHKDWDEFLDCPECAPKLEGVLIKRGWKKPEAKRESRLI